MPRAAAGPTASGAGGDAPPAAASLAAGPSQAPSPSPAPPERTQSPAPPERTQPYYGVRGGPFAGVYATWDEASLASQGVSGAWVKRFNSRAEAEAHSRAGWVACEVCGQAKPTLPFPSCWFCDSKPAFHCGSCCAGLSKCRHCGGRAPYPPSGCRKCGANPADHCASCCPRGTTGRGAGTMPRKVAVVISSTAPAPRHSSSRSSAPAPRHSSSHGSAQAPRNSGASASAAIDSLAPISKSG